MVSITDLQDRLQAEFCPPLDTTVVAAFLGDISTGDTISDAQLNELRDTLSTLAAQATVEQDDILAFSSPEAAPLTDDDGDDNTTSSSLPELSTDTGATSLTSDPSASAGNHFASPLGFLQAAFPHVDPTRLRQALGSAGGAEDADMEDVVAHVLSSELIRELEERDLAPAEAAEYASDWVTVPPKARTTPKAQQSSKAKKASKAKPRTISLVDVRQAHHATPARTPASPRPAPDPWIQATSLATRVAELLPGHDAAVFLSALHSPAHTSPADAIRASLTSIAGADEPTHDDTTTLFSMLDVLTSSDTYEDLDAEARDSLVSDAQLALRATQGQADSALDLVWLLRELADDAVHRDLGMYHSPAPSVPGTPTSPISTRFAPSSPVLALSSKSPLPRTPLANEGSPKASKPPKLDTAWHAIPVRTMAKASPHAAFIPAYAHGGPHGRRVRGAGNALGKGGKGDVGELAGGTPDARARARDLRARRDAALREASRAWARGNTRTRGGEVAFYFAERARELQEAAKMESLRAARAMIDGRRSSQGTRNIDLHGTTAAEAVVLVKEILHEEGSSSMEPLTIITGKGTHSAGGVGVLGPAVRNALQQDGWHVRQRDGALVVHGKTNSVRVR